MGFVYEKVPEADWGLYNSFKLRSYGREGVSKANQYSFWTVDRERSIYFIFIGGGANELPYEYAIIWRGEKILIDVEARSMVTDDPLGELHWRIDSIIAPRSLESRKDDIVPLVLDVVNAVHAVQHKIPYRFTITHVAEPKFVDEV